MDIKLLGGSGVVSAAACALFIQYGTGSQASSLNLDDSQIAGASRVNVVKALTRFTNPDITGFLKPAGFQRPAWQQLDTPGLLENDVVKEPAFVVMLDPGHGGVDPGAKAHNGLLEKDLTLDIARRVRLFLSEFSDMEIKLTREHDNGLSRHARVSAIRQSKADMVISLHFNHLPQTDVTLVESYYAGPENIAESQASQQAARQPAGLQRTGAARSSDDLSFTQGSKRLAHTLQQRVFNEVSYENSQADNAGVKQETLFVLTRSFTPGVLIELTCISNINEAEKLNTEDYRNRLAAALADGIRSYRDSVEQSPWNTRTHLGT